MEKTMQDMSTGNQPDGFAYGNYSSFEMGEFYFKKIIPSPLDVEEPGLSRWPWTLEHAGSNPAIQTLFPRSSKEEHLAFN
jgi:hypothetical protein